ncbi:F-box/LRR-repeat protein 17 [Misgurnus anguillicaudatus]|uniref:F-box/LRR-repeat protein 17 n=1 Tax=Misgurnus anguillicaudatus TaxID=75329 RepID=UPI002435F616|nr:F-box/LRR-repeat protein 17 isoform X1 [Misgurnus anguillicaudatus]XP_055024916.1 F-box/LRR-repeat protein 17 isoform X1 [Misgurnus anguillicaudatus]XP_055024917.1 F-box/LRR-repeat protein 17 isoform X2 [Misgurnus anguillicaudatus]XP_055024918.1 F-box/LRR-repeat protein 17 isoform X3 [Misgurnus anguillicaudatus]XP_055024919.1 F-box/LRR-repeat protein 17 isoform X1 [Misgurnus anguillicaudatus]
MGHLLSKNAHSLKKTRKLRKKKKKRNCFLQGPCMLCFIVHGNSGSVEDNWPFESGRGGCAAAAASKIAERYAALNSPEDCTKFVLSQRALWEAQGRILLSTVPAKLIGPPALYCAVVPAADYSEMVCKRKSAELQRCTPRKQPRCAFQESMENREEREDASSPDDRCLLPSLCPLPSSSSSSSHSEENGCGAGSDVAGGASSSSACCLLSQNEASEEGKSPEGPEQSHINQLPSSILLKVFSHLSVKERCLGASLVCKYWRDLCLDFQFWKQIDLSGLQQVKDDLLVKIASRRQNVTEINISDCRNVQDHGICTLASNCTGLVKYTAYRCKQLSDVSLCTVAVHCPLLQKVHVGNQDKLTDEALKLLGKHCRDLRDVHFGQCYSISDDGLVALAQGCSKLQRIYMQENKLVTDKSVQAFAENCPELRFVGFMGCSVTSQGVIHLTRLQDLNSLDLRHISELNNETVMEVVRKCRNLTSLNLCLNWTINDRCVEIIAKEGRSLKELYLVSCKITDHALIAIGQYSSTIETVDAGWCKEITDQGATQIASSSKSLRYLGLMRCDKVNEETVERLVLQYPHIVFSTVMQDCKRTLERAYQMGWNPNTSTTS